MMSEWKKVKLGEICKIIGGGTPSRENMDFWNGDIPWVTPAEISKLNKTFINSTNEYITELGLKESSAKLVPVGSVLMSSRATIGQCVINEVEVTTNQGFTNFICSDMCYNHYLYYVLRFNKNTFEKLASGSTFKEISKKSLNEYEILLPPLPEQQKIADILSSVDEAISKTEAIIEQTEKVKKGLMQELLTKGIGHTKFKQTEIGEIPEEWEECLFSKYVSINPTYKLEKDKEYPFIEMSAVQTNSSKVSYLGKRKSGGSGSRFQRGDVLFARITPCAENGKTCLVTECDLGIGSTEFIVLSPNLNFVNSKFLYYLVKHERIRNYAIGRMTGTTGRKRVPNEVFKNEIVIALPSLEEQNEIVKTLNSIEERIEAEQQKLTQLQTLKKGLMQDLLTGKVRVKLDN